MDHTGTHIETHGYYGSHTSIDRFLDTDNKKEIGHALNVMCRFHRVTIQKCIAHVAFEAVHRIDSFDGQSARKS